MFILHFCEYISYIYLLVQAAANLNRLIGKYGVKLLDQCIQLCRSMNTQSVFKEALLNILSRYIESIKMIHTITNVNSLFELFKVKIYR
jgi:hypothetical protein